MTFPVYQSIGNDPVVSDWVKMHSNMIEEYSLVFLRNLEFISSTPQKEDNFNLLIMARIPVELNVICSIGVWLY